MTQAPTPTEDTVRRLVGSLLPRGTGPDVRPATEGAGPATWWVGTRHVLRLATDRETAARRRREPRLRDLVRAHVPVTVPVTVAHGEWAPGLTYTLDARVPGGSAEDHSVSAVGEADLAALLTGLREVPPRQAETLGVPRAPARSLETLRRSAEAAARRLAVADEFDPARLAQLTGAATAQLGVGPGAVALVHHTLADDHLVVGADGRVRGVLGWADAVLGDPAEDIAGLALAVGSPAAVRAATLAGYGARPCLRGLWLARCDAVVHLAGALSGKTPAPPLPVLRARLRRAWEAILLERVTELRGDAGGGDTAPW
ncbi:aminoglycoside phosphotransferase family protein [Streptomyces tagetis]|uniref:Aminoglycoside phosphotransferase family protein n=1 Tax=Streptomyces tagetis TaxID=2820809 RepID=A0A941AWX6_9ACTN|nr:aminoglycoside phosphotransferase family protein [Streptomyces sp. RG38]MBQ0825354.1 aminoglycoside phosphotransferase family protein [Streptomyces sp. RG38]